MTTGPATNTMRSPRGLGLAHQSRDPRHAGLDAALGRDLVDHEREIAALAVAELGRDADALEPAHDLVADPDLAQLPADRLAAGGRTIAASMRCSLDVDPAAADPHLRALVGRGVEVLRRAAVAVGRADERVLLADRVAAERDQILDEPRERRFVRRRDLERQPRDVVVRAAELEVLHLEVAAALDHAVEDRLQELRVDEVTFRGDDGGVRQCG